FRPVLQVGDAEFQRLRYELTTLPPRTTWIVTVLAVVTYVVNALLLPDWIIEQFGPSRGVGAIVIAPVALLTMAVVAISTVPAVLAVGRPPGAGRKDQPLRGDGALRLLPPRRAHRRELPPARLLHRGHPAGRRPRNAGPEAARRRDGADRRGVLHRAAVRHASTARRREGPAARGGGRPLFARPRTAFPPGPGTDPARG